MNPLEDILAGELISPMFRIVVCPRVGVRDSRRTLEGEACILGRVTVCLR